MSLVAAGVGVGVGIGVGVGLLFLEQAKMQVILKIIINSAILLILNSIHFKICIAIYFII